MTWLVILGGAAIDTFAMGLAIPNIAKWVISAALMTATIQVISRWRLPWYALAFFTMCLVANVVIGTSGTAGFLFYEGALLVLGIFALLVSRRRANAG